MSITPLTINTQDEQLDQTLRPSKLSEFTGQAKIKKHLNIFIQAAKERQEPIDHLLIYGPPGLGKTTLAHIMAQELNVQIRTTSGPALERAGDLASILTNLTQGDILFIDEIHRLNKIVEETLYPAMEDFFLDIVVGKGPAARTLKLDLPRFTIIGATTQAGLISAPLRDRFGAIHKLEFYTPHELSSIISRSAKVLGYEIDPEASLSLANRSRGTPRIANKLLKRTRDVAQVAKCSAINPKIVTETLDLFEIDSLGLDNNDRQFLKIIAEYYQGGPVGLETLAASLSEDKRTLEDVTEPYLMQIGFIKRTSRGRVLTHQAYTHIGLKPPQALQTLFD
jgi:holliday junction DNA helicase RuvB